MVHYRKDNPNGVTAPNPDGPNDIVSHITKCRGMKTALTSVSADRDAIKHFSGELYSTESDLIVRDGHAFIDHPRLIEKLKEIILSSHKEEKIKASRALQLAMRAKEALINWQFPLDTIERKERIGWCFRQIQKYFIRA
jgi:hypothetical protein